MDRYTVHTKAGIHISNSLVHGHVYQPPSQAEVREHQQDFLQPLIEHEQRLATQKKLPQTSKYKNISHNCNIFSKKNLKCIRCSKNEQLIYMTRKCKYSTLVLRES